MYDELVKELRNMFRAYKATDNGDCHHAKTILQAADAIEELQGRARVLEKVADKWCEAVPKWIPAAERLPEAGERVLCYCRANIYEVMKMRTDGDWVYDMNHIYMHSFVTHWMPLPQPPKEETE